MAELYFRQLLAGRDFGVEVPFAGQMQNFVYLVGDRDAGEVLLVDPAWSVRELVELATADGLRIVGALATHHHPDHIGGELMGMRIDGLPSLMELAPCPVHIHRLDTLGLRHFTGLPDSALVEHDAGDRVRVGALEVELLHTPGHTPGSVCYRVGDALITGDTLFIHGCGRVDLPGGDAAQLFHSLQALKALPDPLTVYPGHNAGGASAPLSAVRASNPYLQVPDLQTWMRVMGR